MIIDAHQHAFWHGRSAADLVADMDEQGIDLAWALSWEVPPAEHPAGSVHAFNPLHVRDDGTHPGLVLADQLAARDAHPDRFVLGWCPDPRLPDAPKLFEAAWRMHRVRVCGEWKFRMLLDDPRCLELFRKAGELRCPVVVHIDVPYRPDAATKLPAYRPSWYGGTVDNLARALGACPDTAFIGHAPGFWREISGDADRDDEMYPKGPVTPGGRLYELFETHANLYADLSAGSGLGALRRDREHAEKFLLRFADRLLFGRDIYGSTLREFLDSLPLPAHVRQRIDCGNALKLVPWPIADPQRRAPPL